jgi:hypothetical protein
VQARHLFIGKLAHMPSLLHIQLSLNSWLQLEAPRSASWQVYALGRLQPKNLSGLFGVNLSLIFNMVAFVLLIKMEAFVLLINVEAFVMLIAGAGTGIGTTFVALLLFCAFPELFSASSLSALLFSPSSDSFSPSSDSSDASE